MERKTIKLDKIGLLTFLFHLHPRFKPGFCDPLERAFFFYSNQLMETEASGLDEQYSTREIIWRSQINEVSELKEILLLLVT